MICPECRSEYREGYTRCADCDADLVQPAPEPTTGEADMALVKVYETGSPALIPLIQSLFDDAGIEYMAKGEGLQDLFGWGRFGSGFNIVIGPVQFFVREDEAEEARRILETLAQPVPPADEGE